MKEYQPIKRNPWILPHEVYMQTIWTIRDYPRLQQEYNEVKTASPSTSSVHSGRRDESVEREAMRLAQIKDKINSIEKALELVPEEYRQGVIDNVITHKRYPDDAGTATYSRWKSRFIYGVAKRLGYY